VESGAEDAPSPPEDTNYSLSASCTTEETSLVTPNYNKHTLILQQGREQVAIDQGTKAYAVTLLAWLELQYPSENE